MVSNGANVFLNIQYTIIKNSELLNIYLFPNHPNSIECITT